MANCDTKTAEINKLEAQGHGACFHDYRMLNANTFKGPQNYVSDVNKYPLPHFYTVFLDYRCSCVHFLNIRYRNCEHFLWNCSQLKAKEYLYWWVNTSIRVMALCSYTTVYHLNQCWPRHCVYVYHPNSVVILNIIKWYLKIRHLLIPGGQHIIT